MLPFPDRMMLLIASVVDNERNAAVKGLIELVHRMALQYNIEERIEFAERLQNAADHLDHDKSDEARWMTERT